MTGPADPGGPDDPGSGPEVGAPDGVPVTAERVARAQETRGRARRRRRRWLRLTMTISALVLLVVVGLVVFYEVEANPSGPPGAAEVVQVTQGEPLNTVLGDLAAKGVIGSSLAFRLGDLVLGSPSVQPGAYLFHRNQSFGTVRHLLAAGPDVYGVDVLAGQTLSEVADSVSQVPGQPPGAFAAAARSGAVHSVWQPAGSTDLEGLLGPGFYQVLPGETDVALLRQMVTRFDAMTVRQGLSPASAAALGLTPYQVLIAASIVEKEGYITKNMGPVARVIYNRLAAGDPLQMDSTVLYSLGQDGGPVTPHDLTLPTPYNTYLNKGLTPTPICIPSPQAVAAAVHPTPGSWLFFVVVDKDGTEAFADTYAEQQANERLAQSRGL